MLTANMMQSIYFDSKQTRQKWYAHLLLKQGIKDPIDQYEIVTDPIQQRQSEAMVLGKHKVLKCDVAIKCYDKT